MTQNVPHNVLIVTAASDIGRKIMPMLAERGIRGVLAANTKAAIDALASCPWHLVFVDLADESDHQIELVARLRSDSPDLPVVTICNEGSIKQAVRAMQAGASEVVTLPMETEEIETILDQMLPSHEINLAAVGTEDNFCLYRIAGNSKVLLDTIELARRVARSSMPVLVTGESGTGKELLSYLIHQESNRSKNPYIRVNCAALSESLLESELFGHERGAFTGAYAQRKGRFEMAHRGTLLLDEITETGPRLQAELLRVLEQQDFERVGGSESINVNVRVICTSNRDLAKEVAAGRFRADLYYRIRGVQLRIPSLRERIEDLPALTWHFVNLYAGEARRQITELDDEMMKAMGRCDWPGNIRQLRNIIRTALVLGQGNCLSLEHAPHLLEDLEPTATQTSNAKATLLLQDLERQAVIEALRQTNSHQAKAAQLLGISDRTLREKMRRYRQDGHMLPMGEEKWSTSRAS